MMPCAVVEKLIKEFAIALEQSQQDGTEKIAFEILSSDAPLWDLDSWEQLPSVQYQV